MDTKARFVLLVVVASVSITSTWPAPAVDPGVAARLPEEAAVRLHPLDADYPLRVEIGSAALYAQRAEQLELASSVMAAFEDLGLDLPAVSIWFQPGFDDCSGNAGYRLRRGGEDTVYVCNEVPYTLAHELGHVWVAANVSDEQRARFVAARSGAHSWADPEHDWQHRGTEHAANVFAWAVTGLAPVSTQPSDRASLEAAFELLTEGSSPGFTDVRAAGAAGE